MPSGVHTSAYGRAAALALRDAIADAQRHDPLAPVTVVVARSSVGLAMRRLLASGELGVADGRSRAGVANVTFTTLRRLADQLAGPVLAAAGRRPLSTAVLHAAVRQALRDAPGPFEPVRSHPATAAALARVWREMRGANSVARARLAASGVRAAAVLDVLDRADALLEDRFDEHDLLVTATNVLAADAPEAVGLSGAVIVHLPERPEAAALGLLRMLVTRADATVLLGLTGNADADAPARDLAEALGAPVQPVDTPLRADAFVSAPSADTEVLRAVRTVLDAHRAGTPLERTAILYSTDAPYARMLHEELTRNGIAHHGPGVRTLAATVAGRTMLGLLALPVDDFRRDQVIDWLSSAPLRHAGARIDSAAWDRASRSAGIVHGEVEWQERLLALHTRTLEERDRAERDDAGAARLETSAAEAVACEELRSFMAELVHTFDDANLPATWHAWAAWSAQRLRGLLGGAAVVDRWPSEERQALDEMYAALERLGSLDELDPAPTLATFTQALRTELASGAPTTTRFGLGTLVAPYRHAAGLDLDLLVVVGMTDTALPGRPSDDPLLPDEERAAADDTLPLRGGQRADAHHSFLAAAQSAPRRVFSYCRGDLRNGRELRPARWFLDALGAARNEPRTLYARDLEDATSSDALLVLASHTAALLEPGEASGLADFDLRLLAQHRLRAEQPVTTHWLADTAGVLGRSLTARLERRRHDYTRFDGRTDAAASTRPPRPYSPTGLETYAGCPRRYLLNRVLHVQAPVTPERLLRIDVRDRGSLVHKVLERFFARQTELPANQRIAPDQPWTAAHHDELDTLLDEVAEPYRAAGLTGHALLWALDVRVIRRDLHALLHEDDSYRAARRATPAAVELSVGFDDSPPLEVRLRSGRSLSLHGYVDRLDTTECADGTVGAVVLDYKNSDNVKKFGVIETDPVAAGTLLQPVIYGLMARRHLGAAELAVEAGFWLTRQSAAYRQLLIPIDDDAVQRFDEVASVLLDGIERGDFPARPGPRDRGSFENCTFCDYDAVCPRDRDRAWSRVRGDDRLAAYVALTESEGDDGQSEGEGS